MIHAPVFYTTNFTNSCGKQEGKESFNNIYAVKQATMDEEKTIHLMS